MAIHRVLTTAGANLLTQGGTLNITSIKAGEGHATSIANAKALTDIIAEFSTPKVINNPPGIHGTNDPVMQTQYIDSTLSTSYDIKEFGLFNGSTMLWYEFDDGGATLISKVVNTPLKYNFYITVGDTYTVSFSFTEAPDVVAWTNTIAGIAQRASSSEVTTALTTEPTGALRYKGLTLETVYANRDNFSSGSGYTDWTPSNGIALTPGTSHTLTLPNSADLDDYEWVTLAVGDDSNRIDESQWLPADKIKQQGGGAVYVIIDHDSNNGLLGRLNVTTAAFTEIGNISHDISSSAMAWDGDALYTAVESADSETHDNLARVDTTTAASTIVGLTPTSLGTVSGMTSVAGVIYVIENSGDLYTWSTVTGVPTSIGKAQSSTGTLFTVNNTLYGVTTLDSLLSIDTGTGAATVLGAITGMTGNVTAGFVIDGTVYLVTYNSGTSSLYTLNLTTRAATLVANISGVPSGYTYIQGAAYGTAGTYFRVSDYLLAYRNAAGTQITLVPLRTCHVHALLGWAS